MNHQAADGYFAADGPWREEIGTLREIILSAGLEETVKWGMPTYTHGDKNIVGIGAFKAYFGLWFFQGALLSDEPKVLINAQKGKTGALRQWRFTSSTEIDEKLIRDYIREALSLQQSGIEIRPDRNRELTLPNELQQQLDSDSSLQQAFDRLSPGKRREYAEYVAGAKRENTRESRVARIIPMIRQGVGLNDKYRT